MFGVSRLGRGIPGRGTARAGNIYRNPNQDPPQAGGAWASQTILNSDTFIAPSSGVALNKRGKVEVFVTMTAGGGAGGQGVAPNPGDSNSAGWGGQAGQWCRRFKVELNPGEYVVVTIGGTSTGNGASSSFGYYITLMGGAQGAAGVTSASPISKTALETGTSNQLISGNVGTDNAIRSGASGGQGTHYNASTGALIYCACGDSSGVMGQFRGGYHGAQNTGISTSQPGGGGGAGLFGDGGKGGGDYLGAATSGAPNSGAGGGGGSAAGAYQAKGNGAGGQCLVEWRIAA